MEIGGRKYIYPWPSYRLFIFPLTSLSFTTEPAMLNASRMRHRRRRLLPRAIRSGSLIQLNVSMSSSGLFRKGIWKRVCWVPDTIAAQIPEQGCIYIPNETDRKTLRELCFLQEVEMMPIASSAEGGSKRLCSFHVHMADTLPPENLADREVRTGPDYL